MSNGPYNDDVAPMRMKMVVLLANAKGRRKEPNPRVRPLLANAQR
jgi:hypothetical protein